MSPDRVIVIGAGAAGLYAARLLHESGAAVTVLEAADRPGGRVKSIANFAAFPLELGAEEIHGEKSLSYRLSRAQGLQLRACRDRLYLWQDLCAGQRSSLRHRDPDLMQAQRFVDALPDYAGPDVPLARTMATLPPRARTIVDAMLGNEYGADSKRLGVQSLATAEAAWQKEGTRNYLIDGAPLLALLTAGAPAVRLGEQVTTVDWSGSEVVVTTKNGGRYLADQILITVPLPILRDGDITFTPPLPKDKLRAARDIGFGPILKIFLRFRCELWPPRHSGLTMMGIPHAPQLWSYGLRGEQRDRILTAFVAGRAAEALLDRGEKLLPTLLAELDQALSAPGERVATRALVDHLIKDWSREPFIRGGYSYPTVGSAPHRAALAQPLKRGGASRPSVAFAGEATHDRLFGSLQGALLSAERAVRELLAVPS